MTMNKLIFVVDRYGPVFSHGLMAGALLALTVHSGLANGCC